MKARQVIALAPNRVERVAKTAVRRERDRMRRLNMLRDRPQRVPHTMLGLLHHQTAIVYRNLDPAGALAEVERKHLRMIAVEMLRRYAG